MSIKNTSGRSQATLKNTSGRSQAALKNTSGKGEGAAVPPEIEGWNWGAFFFNWIWALGNKTYIGLLALIPVVGLVVSIVLGLKGNEWAWRNKRWKSIEHFKSVQRKWALASAAMIAISVCAGIGMYFVATGTLKTAEPYKLAQEMLEKHEGVSAVLGKPLSFGEPRGNMQASGANGIANFQFKVEGPGGKGTAYVEAVKSGNSWEIQRMALDEQSIGRAIDIVLPKPGAPVIR